MSSGLYREITNSEDGKVYRHYSFSPVDFLEEALDDFLESGENPTKIVSCVIKTHVSIELFFKDLLNRICPALILEKTDDDGLQIAKVFSLGEKMLDKSILDKVELRTINFTTLIKRMEKFYNIKSSSDKFLKLNQIRNGLVHHEINLEIGDINILLAKDIFPFLHIMLESMVTTTFNLKDSKPVIFLNEKLWNRLAQVEKEMVDKFGGELTKKIMHFGQKSESLTESQQENLIKSDINLYEEEIVTESGLNCPSCQKSGLTLVNGVDFDCGVLMGGYFYMKCSVCGLNLDHDEIDYIYSHPTNFFNGKIPKSWKDIEEIIGR